jgi:hypothetical protein
MTMLPWSPNRRGLSCYASTSIILLLVFASYLFLVPSSTTTFDYFDPYSPSRLATTYTLPSSRPTPAPAPWSAADPPPAAWSFDHRRDQRNFGLSDDQCDVAFPDLYREIDRAVAWRRGSGLQNITPADLDVKWKAEMLRAMIFDGQVTTPSVRSDIP